ncbi:hypothetical protein HUT18_19605 [Streptomyces sp. NA04227]|uniref:hypothetical protein n=1 Tax=Streptomyces sp. NA04227 TaxID=2742136 RepID=UPI001591C064|nr:hypothetical protein [Streptomyces sp. NA04227]QKW08250.1 hypothetical protein HUT18_19605 [Streptomyces sp. NA04227]
MAEPTKPETSIETAERAALPVLVLLGACGCGSGCGCGCQSGGPCQCGGCCG